jgi:hypothetical protein
VGDVLFDKEARACDNARHSIPRPLSGVVSDLVVVSRRGPMAAAAGVGLMIGRCALKTRGLLGLVRIRWEQGLRRRIVGYGKPTYF